VWGSLGRLLVTLALIVQIVAPVRASVAMVTIAADPLVEIVICGADQDAVDRRAGHDPIAAKRGITCGLCHLASDGGFAPLPTPPAVVVRDEAVALAVWGVRVEAVVTARLLDHIRGRAPPIFS
jgi:hypothetical protein